MITRKSIGELGKMMISKKPHAIQTIWIEVPIAEYYFIIYRILTICFGNEVI